MNNNNYHQDCIPKTSNAAATTFFEHKFEGWSVWLEPCSKEADEITQEMQYLSNQCGGVDQGTYPFNLHCTLLYNFNPSHLNEMNKTENNLDSKYNADVDENKCSKIGTQMLHRCINKYRKILKEQRLSHPIRCTDITDSIELNATDFYFFPYPKKADNGRGFGCVISMLLLENNHKLQTLQQVVLEIFPPDERHGHKRKCCEQKEKNAKQKINDYCKCDNFESKGNVPPTNNQQQNENQFMPHMALVYAPEIYHAYLQQYTESNLKNSKAKWLQNTLQAKYLSLWSTKGMLKDWKLISRIDLE